MADYLEQVKEMLMNYQGLGVEHLSTGALLIGRAPHVAPKAWLHKLYKPLSGQEVSLVEKAISKKIPSQYRDFLLKTNGLKIFVTALSFYGFVTKMERSGDGMWQPFSIVPPNTLEKFRNASPDAVFIGVYTDDGSRIYTDTSNRVYRCLRYDAAPVNEWDSFEEMLVSEVKRIVGLFDDQGRRIDPNRPVTP